MHIVPVIDIKHGVTVRARHGDRASYAPIETPLSPSPAPLDVARGLLALGDIRRLYIADLDGIEGRGRNDAAIAEIAARWPSVELWVDNGIAGLDAANAFLAAVPARLVLGSESQTDGETVRALGERAVLSLDFRGDAYVGPPALIGDPALWPTDVIAMTLGRVGSGAGPDVDRLAGIAAAGADGRAGRPLRLWAAGGVRDLADLRVLAAAGVSGALIATALHDGRLGAAEIAEAALLPGRTDCRAIS